MTAASLRSRPAGFVSGSSAPSVRERVERVFRYRRILRLLVARDLKVRYAGSALGYVWTVLDPMLMSLVYWFVFTKIFHRQAGPQYEPYMLYLISGQLIWSWFQGGVVTVTRALRSEAQMVRSTNVPRELWVLRVVASKAVEYFLGLPVLAIFALAYMTRPTKFVVLLPLAWILLTVLLLGLGLILAPLCVLVRDVERIVPIVMRVFFYASPVIYSISSAPKSIQSLFTFNPTVGFLTLTHAMFFPDALEEKHTTIVGGHAVLDHSRASISDGAAIVTGKAHIEGGHEVTTTTLHWTWVWHSAVTSVIVLIIGIIVFIRLERPMLKEI
jgi:ABC-type polysaccharide/polyol phosphate export permease